MWVRKPLRCSSLLLFLFSCDVFAYSLDEILRTDQYILVAQQDGFTFFETNVPAEECPRVASRSKNNPALHFIYENVHLFRDPTGVFPPRILMVRAGKHNSKYYLTVLPINSTEIFTDGSETRIEFFDKRTPNPDSRQKAEFIYRKTDLKFTLFDTSNRIFYMDHSTPISYRVEKFYLYDDSQGQTKVIQLENYYNASSETGKRFDWIEDQYAQKFYYKEEVENVTTLFEVPMGIDLIPYLNGARAGTKIGELSAPGKTENAFDGAFFTLETRQPVSGMTAHFSRLDSEDQMSCDMEPVDSKFAILNKLFIIRGNDYCLLRDGPNYDKKNCEEEQRIFLLSRGLIDEPFNFVKWLLTSCILMLILIVLLFVYIYWLRSSFVLDDEINEQNEHETEASLFVAKQRSFPSAYPSELLDVSVDKWN